MKKAPVVLVAIASLATLALGAATAQAAVTTNVSIPWPFGQSQDPNFCTGELLETSGNVHILVTTTVNDNNVSGTFHGNFEHVTAVGLSSGITYQSHDSINGEFKESLQDGNAVVTSTETFSLVAPGGGNNLEFNAVVHMTFDAQGNLTTTKFDSSGICR
jgi:hypothetical protein